MLCVNSYTQEYVDKCRSRIGEEVSAYQALIAAARNRPGDPSQLDAAIKKFEPHFFNSLVLALDSFFVHRARGLEKMDGNPLNEVRMLCNSIMNNNGAMCADETIKIDPAKSVLKHRTGDRIGLSEADFILLSSGFFSEIEAKYS
jgi:hypothetical protein